MAQKKTFGSITQEPVEALAPRGILKAHSEASEAKPTPVKAKPVKKPKQEKVVLKQVSAYFTEAELEIIKEKAGLVPIAKYLRHTLNELGFFDKK